MFVSLPCTGQLAGRADQLAVHRDGLEPSGNFLERHRHDAIVLHGDHVAEFPLTDQLGRRHAKARAQQAVCRTGRAAALEVAGDRHADPPDW